MMEYYLMEQLAENPVNPVIVDSVTYPYQLNEYNFQNIPQNHASYYESSAYTEFPGVLLWPTFMVSSAVKKVVQMYDETLQWKTFMILPNEMSKMEQETAEYWIPNPRRYDCLHEDSVIMPEGTIKKMILDSRKIPNVDIFQIKNIAKNKIVVSLRLAESISRRNIYGICFKPVEIK